MARDNGHNISCGAILFIILVCTVLTVLIIQPKSESGAICSVLFGLFISYIVASYINSSDKFKDL